MTTFHQLSVIPFGKYKGLTIGHVMLKDSSYLKWCIQTIPWFEVDSETESIIMDYALEEELAKDAESRITERHDPLWYDR